MCCALCVCSSVSAWSGHCLFELPIWLVYFITRTWWPKQQIAWPHEYEVGDHVFYGECAGAHTITQTHTHSHNEDDGIKNRDGRKKSLHRETSAGKNTINSSPSETVGCDASFGHYFYALISINCCCFELKQGNYPSSSVIPATCIVNITEGNAGFDEK